MMRAKRVKVRASLDPCGTIDFDLDGVKPEDAKLQIGRASGAWTINFDLQDRTGRELQFDPEHPMWVGEDCPCPPPEGMNSDQLEIIGCEPDTLSILDANSGRARELRYQLNFLSADGSRATCDPVIQNGGGTTT